MFLIKGISQYSMRNCGGKMISSLNVRGAHNIRIISQNGTKNALVPKLLDSNLIKISNNNQLHCYSSSVISKAMNETSSSSGSSSHASKDDDSDNKLSKQSRKEKLKEGATNFMSMAKAYGPVFIGFYLSLYVTTLGCMYVALDLDLFNAKTFDMDIESVLKRIAGMIETFENTIGKTNEDGKWSKSVDAYVTANPKMATFLVGWALTKLTEPPRFLVSVMVVPRLARWLGRVPQK